MIAGLRAEDFWCLVALSGLILIPVFLGLYFCIRIRHSQGWPSTRGVITKSDMIITATGKGGHSYDPVIGYSYHVAGQAYSSRRVKIINMVIGDKQGSEFRQEQYPLGKDVDVYYNPRNPRDAILEKSSVLTCACYMALGLMLIGLIWIVALHPVAKP